MKKLMLQFKKSKLTKPPSHKKTTWITNIIIGCFLIVGCALKIRESNSDEKSTIAGIAESLAPSPPKPIKVIVKTSETQQINIGTIGDMSCEQNPDQSYKMIKKSHWTVSLSNHFGINSLQITTTPNQSNLNIELNQHSLSLTPPEPMKFSDGHYLCENYNEKTREVILPDLNVKDELKLILTQAMPTCNTPSVKDGVWHCGYAFHSVSSSENELKKLQQRMIKRWNRQPYLYSRRLSITKNFATEVTKDHDKALRRLCRVIDSSLKEELPIIFANKQWQTAACSDHLVSQELEDIVKFGLTLATEELTLIHKHAEESSRVGLIQLRIPNVEAPSRNLWVSLKPIQTAKPIQQTPSNHQFKEVGHQSLCWHPLFHHDAYQKAGATSLGFLKTSSTWNCDESKKLTDGASKKKETATEDTTLNISYINQSIIGETEFLVTNGNSKVLRLPLGDYEYVVYEMPVNASEWSPEHEGKKSTGRISWDSKRPRAIIKTW